MPVAVKVIQHSARQALTAIANEANFVLSFKHPNIIKVRGAAAAFMSPRHNMAYG